MKPGDPRRVVDLLSRSQLTTCRGAVAARIRLSPEPGQPGADDLAHGGREKKLAEERLEHGQARPGLPAR